MTRVAAARDRTTGSGPKPDEQSWRTRSARRHHAIATEVATSTARSSFCGPQDVCQRANGDGYIGAVPNSRALWKDIAAGRIDSPGFSLNDTWAPLYNIHKTFAGLRDAWIIAGNKQARDMLVRFADWCGELVANLSDEQVQLVLNAEHGGMNEVLADVYAITGKSRYLALARRFSHRAILDPLLRREDRLDGLHANTQIPKVIGFARIGELSGGRVTRGTGDLQYI
jgi:DUF1680 family protein